MYNHHHLKYICLCVLCMYVRACVLCMYVWACVLVHVHLHIQSPECVFASSHFFHRPSLQYGHRHVEPWLHPSRAVHGIPTVPWGERGGAAGLHHGDVGIPQPFPSGRGTKKEALLWWVIRGDVGRKACVGKERVVELVASICGFISVKELFYMPHGCGIERNYPMKYTPLLTKVHQGHWYFMRMVVTGWKAGTHITNYTYM